MIRRRLYLPVLAGLLFSLGLKANQVSLEGSAGSIMRGQVQASFNSPWSMVFLSDTELLVTEKPGALILYDLQTRRKTPVGGLPALAVGGQGGLGDVILHPDFADNRLVYLSYAEPGAFRKRGAAVMRATLVIGEDGASLAQQEIIWRQQPKVTGQGHYGHRLAFDTDGYLFITSGERQKFDPAQDMSGNLGKMIRLHDDGRVPDDNPFAAENGVTREIWSSGHRNPLGLIITPDGRVWSHEMGPRGGDELNLVIKGKDYGYPAVSQGDHYNGTPIPRHETRPEFEAPVIFWNPSISPAGFTYYGHERFPRWQGSAFMGGLSSASITQIQFDGANASIREQFFHNRRVREVETGPDGSLWMLEDDADGRLIRLQPGNR